MHRTLASFGLLLLLAAPAFGEAPPDLWGAQACWEDLLKRLPLDNGFGGTAALPEIVTQGAEEACGKGAAACTSGVGDRVRVYVNEFQFSSGKFRTSGVMCHELVHARLRQVMNPSHYGALKEWQREGIAVYFSGEAEARVNAHLWENWRAPETGIGTIVEDNAQHGFKDYLRDALTFEYLDNARFNGRIVAILQRLARGQEFYGALEAELPGSASNLRQETDAYSRSRLRRTVEAWPKAFFEGYAALKAKDYPLAERKFIEVWGSEVGERTNLPQAIAAHEYAVITSGDAMETATRILRGLLFKAPLDVVASQVGHLRQYVAIGDLKIGLLEEALELNRLLLKYHADQEKLVRGATLAIAKIYPLMQRWCDAVKWIRAVPPSYVQPGTRQDLELKLALGISLYRTGETEAGLALVRLVAAGTGNSAVREEARQFLADVQSGAVQPGPGCGSDFPFV